MITCKIAPKRKFDLDSNTGNITTVKASFLFIEGQNILNFAPKGYHVVGETIILYPKPERQTPLEFYIQGAGFENFMTFQGKLNLLVCDEWGYIPFETEVLPISYSQTK